MTNRAIMGSATMILAKTFLALTLLTSHATFCVAFPIQSTIETLAEQPAADQPSADQSVGQAPFVAPQPSTDKNIGQAPFFAPQPSADQNIGQAPFIAPQPSADQNIGQAPVIAPQPSADQNIGQAPFIAPQPSAGQNIGHAPVIAPQPSTDQNIGQAPFIAPQPSTDQNIGQAPFIAPQPSADQNIGQAPFLAPQPSADQNTAQAPFIAPQPSSDQNVGQAPAQSPSSKLPPRTFVAVQGVVYCKPCQYQGVDTLLGASPLAGATVTLTCNNTKRPLNIGARTDQNGFFFLQAPNRLTSYGSHKCKVFLSSSPSNACNKHTDLHFGHSGAPLKVKTLPNSNTPFTIYSIGPFAFEPTTCTH